MPGPKRKTKKSTAKKAPIRTTKTMKLDKTTTIPKETTKTSDKKLESSWAMQKEIQKEIKKSKEIPKGLIFGMKWVGKTHTGCGTFEQKALETAHYIFPSFSPTRVLDCNYAAKTIAVKDFPKAYKNGEIIVINAFVDRETGLPILDPIKRVAAVQKLIKECSEFKDGCLIIDGWDHVEKDSMYYIYRQYKIYEKPNGTLWYKEKMDYDQIPPKKIPERPCYAIIPRMYTPRNNQLRAILRTLLSLAIPVLLICHAEEKWVNDKPTGVIGSNARDFIEDDMAFVIYMENIIDKIKVKNLGVNKIVEKTGRKIVFRKNRYQKGARPEVRVVTQDKFEFTEIFKLLVEG